MLILFKNSFPRLIKSSERIIKSSERVIMSSERLIKSLERLINSWERLILCRRNVLLTRRLLCCNASLSHSPTGTECPRPHQACYDSTPVHLVMSREFRAHQLRCPSHSTGAQQGLEMDATPPPHQKNKNKLKK